MEDKKSKKKTKKNKEWVKNIDTTVEEKKHIKNLQKKIDDKKYEKIENYIVYDVEKQELPKGFIKKETDLINNKPVGKNLERMVERKRKNIEFEIEKAKNEKNSKSANNDKNTNNNSNINLDLWSDNTNSKASAIKFPNTTFNLVPKVALPHPGNSYNPKVQDAKNLIESITNNNAHLLELANHREHLKTLRNSKVERVSDSESDSETDSEDDSEENSNEINKDKSKSQVLNNKMTKTERNKQRLKRINRMMNEEKLKKKQIKVEISNIKSFKKFDKERKKNEQTFIDEKIKSENQKSKREKLLSAGAFIESDEIKLLNDSSLRKVAKNDYVRDKFANILNQGLVGGYNYLTSKDDKQNKK